MKEFQVKVWIPENTSKCDEVEHCPYLTGGYCLLFGEILASDHNYHYKLEQCPGKEV